MLLRLAKYTVDMTRTMARLGILFRQLTNMDTISSPSSDQQPHNTNIHWIPASQGIALFSHRFKSLRSFFSSYFFFHLCSMVLLIQYWHCVLHKYDLLLYLWPSTVFKWCLASSFVQATLDIDIDIDIQATAVPPMNIELHWSPANKFLHIKKKSSTKKYVRKWLSHM